MPTHVGDFTPLAPIASGTAVSSSMAGGVTVDAPAVVSSGPAAAVMNGTVEVFVPTISGGSQSKDVVTPVALMAASGVTGGVGVSDPDDRVGVPHIAASAIAGHVGVADVVAPDPVMFLSLGGGLDVSLAPPQIDGVGHSGGVGRVHLFVPDAVTDGTIVSSNIGTADVVTPIGRTEAVGVAGNAGSVRLIVPAAKLSVASIVNNIGSGGVELPVPEILVSIASSGTGVGEVFIPVPGVNALSNDFVVNGAGGLALNTRLIAMTEYDNLVVTGLAMLDGVLYGATPNGLVRFSNVATDNDVPFVAKAMSAETDLSDTDTKTIHTGYVAGDFSGNMQSRIVMENVERRYTMRRSATYTAPIKVVYGRKPISRYFKYGFLSEGSVFRITNFQIDLEKSGRRRR